MMPPVQFSDLTGKTLLSVTVSDDTDTVTFVTDDGQIYRQFHSQDCCERVEVEDVVGDLSDLIGTPILLAEEVVSSDGSFAPPPGKGDASQTWTFYKLRTIKGSVDIRWFGSSNGYYSEGVYFERIG